MRRTWAEERKARLHEGISTGTHGPGDWASPLAHGEDSGIRLAAAEDYASGGGEEFDLSFPAESFGESPTGGNAEELGPDDMGPPKSLMNPPPAQPWNPDANPGRYLRFFIL